MHTIQASAPFYIKKEKKIDAVRYLFKSEEDRKTIQEIPNFDPEIFKDITGIDVMM